jgi:hypothetical protein
VLQPKDYFQPVGNTGRVICGILCAIFSALVLLLGVAMGLDVWRGPAPNSQVHLTWHYPAVIIVIGFFVSYFSWRLLRGTTAANGVTSMPTWWLQCCGALMLLAGVSMLFAGKGSWWSVIMIGGPPGLCLLVLPKIIPRKRDQIPKE